MVGCEFTPPGKPFHYDTTTIVGSVAFAGQPMRGGWITFFPTKAIGDHVIVPLDDAGRFRTSLAPIGKLQVRIHLRQHDRDRLLGVDARYRAVLATLRGPASPLSLDSKAAMTTEFHFDLVRGIAR